MLAISCFYAMDCFSSSGSLCHVALFSNQLNWTETSANGDKKHTFSPLNCDYQVFWPSNGKVNSLNIIYDFAFLFNSNTTITKQLPKSIPNILCSYFKIWCSLLCVFISFLTYIYVESAQQRTNLVNIHGTVGEEINFPN